MQHHKCKHVWVWVCNFCTTFTKLEFRRQILVKIPNIQFPENFTGVEVSFGVEGQDRYTDRSAEVTKLTVDCSSLQKGL